ncbi:hypothetical protein F8568_002520 [Actinomadura sp. LD22]|uniref:DUF11 domain-containing protein n=1 Tax=Actinomadura physcomitrii TaxID=2650748 RepID=A0A6I4M9A9_9ACTN|nr:hypothetical protein [Actinomadura physcomitrii]MVZ99278.1 hypothetical protein [Actinomadura physcomitrii]
MRTGGSRTRSRARFGAIMAGGALAVPPLMLTGAAAKADPSAVRLIIATSTSAAAVGAPGHALGHTVRVRAEGGVAHRTVLRLRAAAPLTWADRPPGCARLSSGHELRCDLGEVGGARVTRTATVSIPASALARPARTRPAILTIADADNAAPRSSRTVLDLPADGGESAAADAPPAQPQPGPNEGDAHCTADAPGTGKSCQDDTSTGNAVVPQGAAPQCQAGRPQDVPASSCHKSPATTAGQHLHQGRPTQPEHVRPPAHGRPCPHGEPPAHAQPFAHAKPPAQGKPPAYGQSSAQGKPAHHGRPLAHGLPPSDGAPVQHAAPHQMGDTDAGAQQPHHSAPAHQGATAHKSPSHHAEPSQHTVTVYGDGPSSAADGSDAAGQHTWSYDEGVPWDDGVPGAGKHEHHGGTPTGDVASAEDGYPAGEWSAADGGAGYGWTADGGHVKEGHVPDLPVVPGQGRPGVPLPPLNAPGPVPMPNSQAMAGTTSDGTDRGDGRMMLVSPVGMEQGNGTDWAVVLGVAIVAEIGLLWGAACFGLWRRRIALYRAETRAAEARAEAAARGGAYI